MGQVFEERRRNKESSSASVSDLSSENTPGDSELADSIRPRLIDLLVTSFHLLDLSALFTAFAGEAGFVQVVVTGRAGDGGIDRHGTLQVSPLVSFKVLFQCKKYAGSCVPIAIYEISEERWLGARTRESLSRQAPTAEARREASRDGVVPMSSSMVRSL